MNKAELIETVQNNLGDDAARADAERAIDAVLNGIRSGIQNDQSVQIVGFGTFAVVHRAARRGINPNTREPMDIKASRSVKFKPAAAFKALA